MKKENIFWGFFLIIAAVFLIISKMGFLAGISIFTIFWSIMFVAILIKGLISRSFTMVLFPIAFLCIIYDEQLGITALTPWTVLLAALLGSIGLNMLFRNKHNLLHFNVTSNGKKHTSENLSGENIWIKNTFSGSSKYINTDNFIRAELENTFGDLDIYFDKAVIQGESAEINISNSFGDINIYVPNGWRIVEDVSTSFGDFNTKGYCNVVDGPTVYLRGSVSFGDVTIIYL